MGNLSSHPRLLDCLKGLPQVLDQLFVEQDHEPYRAGAAYVVFAIGGARICHGDYPVGEPMFGVVLLDLLDVTE